MAYPGYPGYPGYQPAVQSEKPSAHMEGPNHVSIILNKGHVISNWSPTTNNGHIAGGMVYNNGKLRVPVSGVYMVYCQIYFNPRGPRARYYIKKNNGHLLIVAQSTAEKETEGSVHTSGLFRLNGGDEVYVEIDGTDKVWMGPAHCFFGAHLI